MKFLILSLDLTGPSLDPVDLKWFTQEGAKDGYPYKVIYYTTVGCM